MFLNGDNRSGFLYGSPSYILYLWHKADSNPGVLGNMLQILGIAVMADCDNVSTDCAEVKCKQKAGEKSEAKLKDQSQFCHNVGRALVSFATNESMAAYASSNRELRTAEVELEMLKDEIEEAIEDGNKRKAERLKKRLAHWKQCNEILENMLHNAAHDRALSIAAAATVNDTNDTNKDNDKDAVSILSSRSLSGGQSLNTSLCFEFKIIAVFILNIYVYLTQ
jgi:hypothetical protein